MRHILLAAAGLLALAGCSQDDKPAGASASGTAVSESLSAAAARVNEASSAAAPSTSASPVIRTPPSSIPIPTPLADAGKPPAAARLPRRSRASRRATTGRESPRW